jgi:hypothetical protein
MRLYVNGSIDPHVTVRGMFNDAVDLGLASGSRGTYRITPKGSVFAKALLAVPLPVQAEPEWKMPPRS